MFSTAAADALLLLAWFEIMAGMVEYQPQRNGACKAHEDGGENERKLMKDQRASQRMFE